MSKAKELVLGTLKEYGKIVAQGVQEKAAEMSGTELYAKDDFIPYFNPERQYLNYKAGYVCKSAAGRVVRLIQPYDSTIYTGQPEELAAHWGFVWSTDPKKALPFVAISTSPYNKGEYCTEDGVVYRSLIDTNTFKPSEYPQGWEVYVA